MIGLFAVYTQFFGISAPPAHLGPQQRYKLIPPDLQEPPSFIVEQNEVEVVRSVKQLIKWGSLNCSVDETPTPVRVELFGMRNDNEEIVICLLGKTSVMKRTYKWKYVQIATHGSQPPLRCALAIGLCILQRCSLHGTFINWRSTVNSPLPISNT